jgi:hypothetical protein
MANRTPFERYVIEITEQLNLKTMEHFVSPGITFVDPGL